MQNVVNNGVFQLHPILYYGYFVLNQKKNIFFPRSNNCEEKLSLRFSKTKRQNKVEPPFYLLLAPLNYSIFLKFQQPAFINITSLYEF